jgi:hypothetical protein
MDVDGRVKPGHDGKGLSGAGVPARRTEKGPPSPAGEEGLT